MPELSYNIESQLIGNRLIEHHINSENSLYLFFTAGHCNNCASIYKLLDNNDNIKYLKIMIDSEETDDYMEYLENNTETIKIPTLIKICNRDIVGKFIGEENCKKELYSIDESDDF